MLNIVMYHYVRDLARSRYPRIKGRTIESFESQLDYIAANYHVCTLADIIAAMRVRRPLPARACILTFDDGLRDHYDVVFPRLRARRWTGAFFPPAHPIEHRNVLDVHKLHFVLAACDDADLLAHEALGIVADHRDQYEIPDEPVLRASFSAESRFDPPSIIFIKRLLQHGLPPAVRTIAVDALFAKYVTRDEKSFADELYATPGQLREMKNAGMEIGGHGDRHEWLEHLPGTAQKQEIDRTLAFLSRIHGRTPSDWAMCYPYGSYNATTMALLRNASCSLGLTTRVGTNTDLSRPLELMRLDTNDLPSSSANNRAKPPEAMAGHL